MKQLIARVERLEQRRAAGRVIPNVVIYRPGETKRSMLNRHFEQYGNPSNDFFYVAIPARTDEEGYENAIESERNRVESKQRSNERETGGR